MATTKTTEELFSGNGSQTSFPFTIEYLKTSDIAVRINGVLQTATTNYSVVGTNIVFVTAPSAGTNNIKITRVTDIDTARSIYAAGSSIRAKDLNSNQDQILFKLQEKESRTPATTTSSTPPTDAVSGDIWYDTVSGRSFIYYTDADTSQWVQSNPPFSATAEVTTASQVNFTQTGTSNIVTLQSKLNDIISVKDFGAVGNGTTDDTTAIQNAVNQLNTLATTAPATLIFPAGSYKITAPINFSQNAGNNFRREIVGGNGTMAVAKIRIAYHGYGSNLVSGNDKGAFFFGPATGSGNSNEFSLSGFHFEAFPSTPSFKHPPAIECKGVVQSRFNNIVIGKLENSGLSISSPQNCKFFNVSVWECGRSFEYKNSGIEGATGVARVVVDQNKASNLVNVDTTLSTDDTPFKASDKFKTIALWSSSATNQFRQKCKITSVNNISNSVSSQVTVDVQQPDLDEAILSDKNLIFGSPHITTESKHPTESNPNVITADATTFTADDVGAYIWLRVANPTTIADWGSGINYSSAGTLVKNNGRIYRSLGNIGAGKLQPTHAKTKKDIDEWAANKAYIIDDLVINSGNIYKALTSIPAQQIFTITENNITEASPGVFTSTAHGLTNGTRLKYNSNGGTNLVTGTSDTVADGTVLFVVNADTNTFRLASTSGGTALQVSNNGNNSQTFTKDFAPTHTTPSTNASPGDQDINGWEYVPWDEMRIGLYRRKIVSVDSISNGVSSQVTLDAPIGANTTTANGSGSEEITCEIAVPAIDINSDHGSGNSSDNKFVNLQIESHKGVGVCAEDQSLLDFATTKIHSEQGSNALLSSAVKYSIAALWLHQVDGSYNGSTDGQYIGDNRIYVSAQSAGFILNDFITRTANHEQIIAIDEKNGFFDGSSLIIDNMSITGGVADDGLKDVVNDLSGSPVGYVFTGAFVNQGSDENGPIVGHITQNAYVEEVAATGTRFYLKNSSAPTTNPTGGIFIYSENGVLKYRQPDGTVKTITTS